MMITQTYRSITVVISQKRGPIITSMIEPSHLPKFGGNVTARVIGCKAERCSEP
jgi:hypothetical protein